MFERVLFDVLTEGLTLVAGQNEILRRFVATLPLQDQEEKDVVEQIIRDFAAQKKPVIHGFARDDCKFPVWAITLSSEQEDMRSIGDESDDYDEAGQPIHSSIWTSTYQILVYAEHPDVALYLYTLARALLLARRRELAQRAEILEISTITGAELSPDRIYLPAFLFVRALTITAKSEQREISLSDALGLDLPVKAVTGLYVEDLSIPPDGLRHRVKTHGG